ncbi:hypothetical protein [Pyxidicoccus caerfyrddinensis]|uniref:hypothetical protein n=1 Tax=Pyxidicoccus caerfyrddinensis TaxID=2709663 RepID=UPI0013DAD45E|nr:hypothetical protein [Pyxidicoccus caerfyrddinensis]
MSALVLSCPALLLVLSLAGGASPPPVPSAPRKMPLTGGPSLSIQFRLPKERFTAAEARSARIILRNEGTEPLELRDPFRDADQSLAYTLTGPEFPDGLSVTWRSFVLRNPAYVLTMDEAPRIRLGAGQAIEFVVDLHEWLPATRPGRYRLGARLQQEKLTVSAAPVEFEIVSSSAGVPSLGFVVAASYADAAMAAWIQDVDGQPMLMANGYDDQNAEDTEGGVTMRAATLQGPVEPGSTEALVPWSNDAQGDFSVHWLMWRHGTSLVAVGGMAATTLKPFRFDLGETPERIVRPPLESVAGELFVPVVGAGGRTLRLIRFQTSNDATEVTPGREVGRVILPGVPVAARATIQPSSVGNGVSVLLVEESLGGLDLHHVRTTSTGRLTRVASTLVRGARALPGSEPGLWMDTAGRLHALLVAASPKNPRRALLVEARYRADGRMEAPPRVTPLGLLPDAPRAAVARYRIDAHRGGEPYWAILLEDGRVLHRDSNDSHGPMKTRNPAAVPLELFLSRDDYLLSADPVLGPTFEQLR